MVLGKHLSASCGLIALAGATMLLSACTTSSTLTASYAPSSQPIKIRGVNPERDASDRIRDRVVAARPQPQSFDYASIYAARVDEGIAIPAFNYKKMNARYLRRQVVYYGPKSPGTIIVDAKRKLLYLIEPGGMAMRYGIAVGKEGFGWTGNAILQWKQKWPTWTPPAEMIARKPELKKYADGLKGDASNPLGARAMYLFKDGRDTMYRIHGTTKPHSIGKAASSGCFRMINQDVIDLYRRVGTKNRVLVKEQVDETLVSSR